MPAFNANPLAKRQHTPLNTSLLGPDSDTRCAPSPAGDKWCNTTRTCAQCCADADCLGENEICCSGTCTLDNTTSNCATCGNKCEAHQQCYSGICAEERVACNSNKTFSGERRRVIGSKALCEPSARPACPPGQKCRLWHAGTNHEPSVSPLATMAQHSCFISMLMLNQVSSAASFLFHGFCFC